ncbi:protein OBERON 2-like isoform X1 [Tripterygium wilfordii]|uniref:protein OBERON 2-like isoform X1 n=1 Tax=Tripterygium wilfordii TaxID=458696 RepID=UPI0018F826F3|nr:protein OBERON 2-like isoform X1 [Tripterygium wilfordii]XP_038723419.1 protein OBERON 2-like isoform X1 [Tripterygium wilfordii]XP_038723420.1 protein OBERON 2-like isoform X1 [Tripterygium wilfordii]XP_038723421.1 protein OBERON 2-like isoform X1 [Tripterygium wilfordii]XP_038723423.1 protein OBERON 2-like isoform X1 [Tripterygium wilfordii]XP_038723424.1 protein OBERON 2-like isoform X1 [Tripterygium wilfordii]XP_038723425.1 protein OBERON 2-like isoform X1 [Tripterygium wilfordii]XP_0
METDNESNMDELKANRNFLRPVDPEESGEGLPYAPVDWPNPGDIWGWKVGRRVALTGGHYLDRYLYLPSRLCSRQSKKRTFASKLSVEHYIEAKFPNADIDAFFASFSWKIPSKNQSSNGKAVRSSVPLPPEAKHSESVCESDTIGCKAGNKTCSSFMETAEVSPSAVMPCNICCAEPRFCRECCCILCSKTVTSDYRGYSYLKCQAIVGDGYICGHVAHINCGLRSYLAGTVGGSIGLDAEYYCRRCDARTDLVPYVKNLLKNWEDINSRDDLDKILNVGLCILRGSRKIGTRELLSRIELAIAKLKCGASLDDIFKTEDAAQAISTGAPDIGNATLEATNHQDYVHDRTNSLQLVTESSDYLNESLKLENEIDEVLQALRKSQELEYKIAEDQLYAQKNYLRNLYQQLDRERSALAHRRTSRIEPVSLLTAISNRLVQVNREIMKLREMEEVAKGFGKTPNRILKEHFGRVSCVHDEFFVPYKMWSASSVV